MNGGTPRVTVAIVGAGFAGLGLAIQLKRAGIDDFLVFEKSSEVGGTWWENTYPGCACDTMSLLYSYSFEPKADWSRMFPGQAEILDYIRHCADKYEVRGHVVFDTTVVGAHYDEDNAEWILSTADGNAVRARVAVLALGLLHLPHYPSVPGRERFQGTIFHSAQWNHEHDLTGQRVAVVGTGSSAVQFVPEIAEQVAHLTVFQRTPPWILPKPDRRVTGLERWLFRKLPATQWAYRAAISWRTRCSVWLCAVGRCSGSPRRSCYGTSAVRSATRSYAASSLRTTDSAASARWSPTTTIPPSTDPTWTWSPPASNGSPNTP